ncbi:MAG TPA: DNA primase [Lactovum miscens]|uniref:DNA primase n=1 Tax=Lactovum miscens TaxID=190387 RepID=UPI002ED8C909
MAIPKEEITEIRNSVNIADFIGQFVALKKSGQGFQGLCPFHNEKSPSFNVTPSKGIFKCFGCGKGGSIFDFVMEYKKIGFQAAVKEVADFAGIHVQIDQADSFKANPNANLYEINNQASYIFENYLLITEQGNNARDYLKKRGVNEKIAKQFNLGLSADSPNFLYQGLSKKFEEDVLAKSGLFNFSNKQAYDVYQNRLMFTIHDQNGQVIGFSGRIWQENDERQGKYVNTTTTPIFEKSDVLYNLHRAKDTIKKTKEVYLMEGFMDVIAAYKSGINNAVAIMGTALTEKHIKTLARLASKIVLVTDGDKAGQAAIEKSLKVISNIDVQIVKIPDAQDPDEYARDHGALALENLLINFRMSKSEFLMDYLRPTNLNNVVNQLEFLQKMAEVIAGEKNTELQTVYMRRLVEILPDFEYNQVEQAVKNVIKSKRPNQKSFPINSSGQSHYSNQDSNSFSSSSFSNRYEESDFASYDAQEFSQSLLTRKITKSEKLEWQLLHRMLLQPDFLEKISQDVSVKFIHRETASLYDAMILEQLTQGMIDDIYFPESLDPELRNLYYDILAQNLPEVISENELDEILSALRRETILSKVEKLKLEGLKAQNEGNQKRELELANEIFQLRKSLQDN